MLKEAVLALLLATSPQDNNATCYRDCATSVSGISFVQRFEGYSPVVYKDSAGKNTIGFGHLIKPGEVFRQPMTGEEAFALLQRDLSSHEKAVNRLTLVTLKQYQFDALLSFTYNLGPANYQNSTLRKLVNAARHNEVPPKFLPWHNVRRNGKLVPLNGLKIRRQAEADKYAGK